MPYAIMRFAKRKRGSVSSMEAHNKRKKELERGASAMETHRKHIPVWPVQEGATAGQTG